MKAINIIQPQALAWPIAIDGKKNNIPQNPTGSELASVSEGFPAITMKPIKEGGLPPRGEDCNGLFYLSTDQKVFLQNGGIITFNQTVSDLIEGYPKGAVLDYLNSNGAYCKVESLIDDNTNNFIENPQYIDNINWKKINYVSDFNNYITNAILEAPNGVMNYSDSAITVPLGLRVLIPNGRNDDGTLKNIDMTLAENKTYVEAFSGQKDRYLTIDENGNIDAVDHVITDEVAPIWESESFLWYKPSENKTYKISSQGTQEVKQISIGFYKRNDLEITEVYPYDCVNLITSNTLKTIPHIIEQYQNGYSFYRIYSDGRCVQGGYFGFESSGNVTIKVNLLKEYANANYLILTSQPISAAAEVGANSIITARDTKSITFKNNQYWESLYWQADGYLY